MRYALIKPSTDVSGVSYVLLEGETGIFGVLSPDAKFSIQLGQELLLSKRTTIEKATSGMSYHSISINILNDKNITVLRELAKKWKIALPPQIAESEQPKESSKNE